MTDVPAPADSIVGSDSTETGTDPVGSVNSEGETNFEWRFDIDFRLNPNWLTNPGTGRFPMPLSMLNDWIRNIQRPLSSESQLTASSGSWVNETMRLNGAAISSGSGTRPVGDESHVNSSHSHNSPVIPRVPVSRPHYGSSVLDLEQGRDFPPLQTPSSPSRRNSRPTVIDLPEINTDWPSNTPVADADDHRPEEPLADSPERTATDIIRQSPEARAFLSVLERYFPFVLILLMKGILDHGSGLTVFLGLVVTFSHANALIRKEVTKQGKRSLPLLLMIIVNLLICIFCLYYVFQHERLYPALLFLPTGVALSSIYALLWLVVVTDYVVKFLTVIVKSVVIMLPERSIPFQKRGKYYLFIESSSQLYRGFLPIHPCLLYLFDAYDGSLKVFAIILCIMYIICKVVDIAQRLKAWKFALKKFLQQVHYGTVPSEDEMNDLFCPICHDGFSNPTKLSCSHIFCEDCVSTWLDRGERSCPMCRARVVDDTSWRDGRTSHFIQSF